MSFEIKRRATLPSALLVASLAVSCATGSAEKESVDHSNLEQSGAVFEFDDLGGGSSTIMVYEGPGTSEEVALNGAQIPEC